MLLVAGEFKVWVQLAGGAVVESAQRSDDMVWK